MFVTVELLAFNNIGAIPSRIVEIDDSFTDKPVDDVLNEVFRLGQNDFQPIEGTRSVSVGDIINLEGKRHGVAGCGFINDIKIDTYINYIKSIAQDRHVSIFPEKLWKKG